MSKKPIGSTQEIFRSFLIQVKSQKSENVSPEVIERLEANLKNLRSFYKTETNAQKIINDLGLPNERVVRYLGLGPFREEYEYTEILKILAQEKTRPIDIAVIEFLKSHAGFVLANSPSKSFSDALRDEGVSEEEGLREIQHFFGGNFGIQVTNKVLKSIKAEDIGCLLTFAMTDRVQQEVENFRRENPNKKDDALFRHLLQAARKNDYEFKMINYNSFDTIEGVLTNNTRNNASSIRTKSTVDTFMTSSDGKNIYITNSTSTQLSETQGVSFINYYKSALKYSRTPQINGKPNPLYGAKVHANYFMSGLFPDNSIKEGQQKQRNMINFARNADLDQQSRTDLAQSVFFGLLSQCHSTEEALILFCHNPIIAGCDTLDLYHTSCDVRSLVEAGQINEATKLCCDLTMSKMQSSVEALTRLLQHNDLANGGSGQAIDTNQTLIHMIENVTGAINKLPKVFDLENNTPRKQKLQESLKDLLNEAGKSNTPSFSSTIEKIENTCDLLSITKTPKRSKSAIRLQDLMNPHFQYQSVNASPISTPLGVSDINFKSLVPQIREKFLASQISRHHYMVNRHLNYLEQSTFKNNEDVGSAHHILFSGDKGNMSSLLDDLESFGLLDLKEFFSATRFLTNGSTSKRTAKVETLLEVIDKIQSPDVFGDIIPAPKSPKRKNSC